MRQVTTHCPICQSTDYVEVKNEDYLQWEEGLTIQKAFPYLNPNQREQLQTGICTPCWDDSFGEEE